MTTGPGSEPPGPSGCPHRRRGTVGRGGFDPGQGRRWLGQADHEGAAGGVDDVGVGGGPGRSVCPSSRRWAASTPDGVGVGQRPVPVSETDPAYGCG
jgi:hypothetical protein